MVPSLPSPPLLSVPSCVCVFSCWVTARTWMLQNRGWWPSAGREIRAQQDSFFLCLMMSQSSGGKTHMAGGDANGGAASSGQRCTPVSVPWWRRRGSVGPLNHSTWMWPLQGAGLWAPANRAKRLMSHVHHSATCCHRPPRLEEGTQTPSHPGKFAGEVAVSFTLPRHPCPFIFMLGRE